jgi:hypothetical protein
MKRSAFIRLLLVDVAVTALSIGSRAWAEESDKIKAAQPNFLWIIAEDLGRRLGYHGERLKHGLCLQAILYFKSHQLGLIV